MGWDEESKLNGSYHRQKMGRSEPHTNFMNSKHTGSAPTFRGSHTSIYSLND